MDNFDENDEDEDDKDKVLDLDVLDKVRSVRHGGVDMLGTDDVETFQVACHRPSKGGH